MGRYVKQLAELAEHQGVPILCAGDVFDRWNAPAELINWAIDNLPTMYAVPGQHDLPWHGYGQIRKSAYWTLVEAGTLINLRHGKAERIVVDNEVELQVYGTPWGMEIPQTERGPGIHVAVVHEYLWLEGKGYPGAPSESLLWNKSQQLQGYAAAVFGDNHSSFTARTESGCAVMNCGGFIPRRTDERDRQPMVGLLRTDPLQGRKCVIVPHVLDTSGDVWCQEEAEQTGIDSLQIHKFVEELNELATESLDFVETLKRVMAGLSGADGVREFLGEVLDGRG